MKLFQNSPEDLTRIKEICSLIDYSRALVPNATEAMVRQACADAKRMKYAAVPVFPSYIPIVSEELSGTSIAPQCVVGFPDGGNAISAKVKIAQQGIEEGAKEIDMVLNIGRLLGKEYSYIEREIKSVVEVAHPAKVSVKVIIETGFLKDDDKKEAVEIICSAGADFVKTCTGFAEGKATVHDILLLSKCAHGRIKVKASGGVWYLEDADEFLKAGADRIASRYTMTQQLESLGIHSL